MGRIVNGMLDNESLFGRIMGKLWMMIGTTLMFALFSLPVITIGPALAAVFYVMLKSLHTNDYVSPFKAFWEGFKSNLKQGILATVLFAVLSFLLVLDIRFCSYYGGVLEYFKYACYAILLLVIVEAVYLMPVLASFEDTFLHQLRNAFFFAARRPWKIPIAAALFIVPIAVTVLDEKNRPLYAFLWVTIGVGLIAMMVSELLYKDIEQFLPREDVITDEEGQIVNAEVNYSGKSQREILKEMKKLDQ